jgi:hypothetical protein
MIAGHTSLRFNADGSFERASTIPTQWLRLCLRRYHVAAPAYRRQSLVGDDSGIYAFLGDAALQTFGVDGGARMKTGTVLSACRPAQFRAAPSGELLTVSVVTCRTGSWICVEYGCRTTAQN